MKKNLFFLPMLLVILFSCTIESPLSNVVENEDIPLTRSSVTTEDMDRPLILGARLENPYSVANMKLAAQSLLDKGHAISLHPNNITSTHVYVKFLPQNESELNDLVQFDIELFDFPLDYEILEPGNEYRQPGLADSVPNNRYASIEMTLADFEFFIPVERWRDMKPDYNYNFQAWHIGQSEYSPIFIDLIDDYNQRKYFKAIDYKNNYRTNYAVNHPEDFISEVPISEIESMVFSSHSLGVIKMKLKNYAIAYPMMARCLTENNINTLFESYE